MEENVQAQVLGNAAMQQVENNVEAAVAVEAVEPQKSKLEIATDTGKGARSTQHDYFGTHFGKDGDAVKALIKRVEEQLRNLPKWEANLKALLTELKQKRADQNFNELKEMYSFLSDEQKAALARVQRNLEPVDSISTGSFLLLDDMEANYKPKKNGNIKRVRGRLNSAIKDNPALNDYFIFFSCLNEYAKLAFNTFGILREADANYMNFLHLIRILTDAIYKIYGLSLVNNPDEYIYKFMNGEDTNKLRCKSENLSTTTIGKYIKEDYEGLDIIYSESNKYLHPSIFMLPLKKKNRGILSRQSKWVNKKLDKDLDNELRRDYFINKLNDILLDVTVLAYNRGIVPRYPELKYIEYHKPDLRITKEDYDKYVEYRLSKLNNGETPDNGIYRTNF